MSFNYDRLADLLERVYRRILAVYPAEFRHEYAAEMVEYFGEDCRRAARRHGLVGVARQSVRTLGDLVNDGTWSTYGSFTARPAICTADSVEGSFLRPGGDPGPGLGNRSE